MNAFLLGEVLYYVAHIEKDQIGKLFDLYQLIVMVFITQMKGLISLLITTRVWEESI